ncbi:MAG TPA: lipopolysaccharide biosynthesis protein [Pyrinomonadaceae bacterium]
MSSNESSQPHPFVSDDRDRHFRTDHLKADLGGRSARGGAVTLVAQVCKFLLSTVAMILLARLLSPQDYGLIGMAVVVTGFVATFKDMGLSSATIQREEISTEQISTLFWINLGLSVLVALLTAAIAPIVAWFYGDSRLTLITIGLAVGFVFGGLAIQHSALLKRQMRFTALATIDITALLFGLGAAIIVACNGGRYWALVANQLVQGLTYAAGIWLVSGWRPGRPARHSGVRSMLGFGRNLTGFSIINYFARNLDNMLIGRFWGSRSLGLYSRAYQLLLFPIDQINSPIAAVAIPALSRLNDSPERYRQAYLRILQKVAIVTMPGMAFLIVCSDWIVRLALGPQWIEAGRIFALLGIAGMVQPIANTTGWLFISQGRTHHMFQWGLIGCSIIIVSIIAGLPWGAMGVAASYSIVFLLVVTPLLFWFVGRHGPVRTIDFYRTVAPIALAALCVFAALLIMRQWMNVTRPLLGLPIGFFLTIIVTILTLCVSHEGRMAVKDFKRLFALLSRRDGARPASLVDSGAPSSQLAT